jgi:hypothetical protein
MDDDKPLIAFLLLVSFFFGALAGCVVSNKDWKAEVVKQGHAEYHSTTGEWQWKRPSGDQGAAEVKP